MALKDLLTLVSSVSVIRTISTNDGMGGFTTTSSTSIIPLCALWQNGSSNRFLADKYQKISTHTLCYEYGGYTFDTSAFIDSIAIIILTESGDFLITEDGNNIISEEGTLPIYDTATETISYNSETYKRVGYPDDCMQLHEIMVQALERTS